MGVLFREVSSVQGSPYRRVPLCMSVSFYERVSAGTNCSEYNVLLERYESEPL